MLNHPHIQRDIDLSDRLRLRALSNALFHCDIESQFKAHDPTADVTEVPSKPPPPPPPSRDPVDISRALVWAAAASHCLERLKPGH
eukprot:1721010-Alexandrium_andersonii.AAC.1